MALTRIKTGGITDNAITNAKIADNAIDSDDFADGSIDNEHLAGSIATSKLTGALTSVGSHGLAASATTDTTSASNISSGTLAAARVATLNQNTTGSAATVTTNANLTGHVTSSGNAAVLGSFTVAQLSSALSDASISGNNTGDQTLPTRASLNIDTDDAVTFAGITGTTGTFSGTVQANSGSKITSASADTTFSIETTSGTTIFPVLDFVSSHSSIGGIIKQDGNNFITIDNSQNATFAGAITSLKNITIDRSDDHAILTLDVVGNTGKQAYIDFKADRPASGDVMGNLRFLNAGSVSAEIDVIRDSTDARGKFVFYTSANTALTLDADQNATFAGRVLGHAGTAALPSFAFSGDPNTGMYNDGSNDNLKFSTGGVVRAFLSASQWNVTGNLVAGGDVIGVGGTFSGAVSGTTATFSSDISTSGLITTSIGDSIFGGGEADSRIYLTNRGGSSGDDSHFIRGDSQRLSLNAGGSNGEVSMEVNGGQELKILDGSATFAGTISNTGLIYTQQVAHADGIRFRGYDAANGYYGKIGLIDNGYLRIHAEGNRSIDLYSGRQIRFYTSTDNSTYTNSVNFNSDGTSTFAGTILVNGTSTSEFKGMLKAGRGFTAGQAVDIEGDTFGRTNNSSVALGYRQDGSGKLFLLEGNSGADRFWVNQTGTTEINTGGSAAQGLVVDVGLPSSANREIARFSAASARPICFGWIDSGSKMTMFTPGTHSIVLGAGAIGTNHLEIANTGNATFAGIVQSPTLNVLRDTTEGSVTVDSRSVALFQYNNNASASVYATLIGGTTGYAGLHFGDKDDSDAGVLRYDLYSGDGGGGFQFWTEGTQRLEINASGNATFSGDVKASGGHRFITQDTNNDSGVVRSAMTFARGSGAGLAWHLKTTSAGSNAIGDLMFAREGTMDSSGYNTTGVALTLNSSGNVGIGTSSPNSILNIVEDGQPQVNIDSHSADSDQAYLNFQKTGGTEASPSNVTWYSNLGQIQWKGWNTGGGGGYDIAAHINCSVDANSVDGACPGKLRFATANTSGTVVTALTIDKSQKASFGDTGVGQRFEINAGTFGGTNPGILFTGDPDHVGPLLELKAQTAGSCDGCERVGMVIDWDSTQPGNGTKAVGLKVDVGGAVTNYAALFNGLVGIGVGMTDPDSSLEVYGPVQKALHVKGNDHDALYIDTVGNTPYIINARLKNGNTGFQVESTSSSTGLINWVGGALHNNSDRTLKKDITDLGSCLDKVKNLRGVTFKWKTDYDPYRNDTENSRYQMDNIGFIAQELEEEFPAIIDTNDISGLKSIRNNNLQLTAIMVEAIKELSDKLDSALIKIEALENA